MDMLQAVHPGMLSSQLVSSMDEWELRAAAHPLGAPDEAEMDRPLKRATVASEPMSMMEMMQDALACNTSNQAAAAAPGMPPAAAAAAASLPAAKHAAPAAVPAAPTPVAPPAAAAAAASLPAAQTPAAPPTAAASLPAAQHAAPAAVPAAAPPAAPPAAAAAAAAAVAATASLPAAQHAAPGVAVPAAAPPAAPPAAAVAAAASLPAAQHAASAAVPAAAPPAAPPAAAVAAVAAAASLPAAQHAAPAAVPAAAPPAAPPTVAHAVAHAAQAAVPPAAPPAAPAPVWKAVLASPVYTSSTLRRMDYVEAHAAALQAITTSPGNHKVADVCKVEVCGKHAATLKPGEQLCDEVMNACLGIMQAEEAGRRSQAGMFPRCHLWNTFFANKVHIDEKSFTYEAVARWNRQVRLKTWGQMSANILDCDLIFVPVHWDYTVVVDGVRGKPEGHWCLAVIDTGRRVIEYFDSFCHLQPSAKALALVHSLEKYMVEEYKAAGRQEPARAWRRVYPRNIPKQTNTWDCGVFVLMYVWCRSAGKRFDFEEAQMPKLRAWLAHKLKDKVIVWS